MKKSIILSITALILAIIATAYFLFFNKENNILNKVPKNAKSIIIFDLKSLSTKLLLDELTSDTKDASKFAEFMPDSLKNINWKQNGVSLLNKVVFFTTQNPNSNNIKSNLIFSISDYKEFTKFIKTLSTNKFLDIEKNKKTIYIKRYKLLVNWNRKFVIASFLSKNTKKETAYLQNILSIKKEESIAADSLFFKKQGTDYDVFLYSEPYKNYPKKHNKFINSNIQSVTSFVNFNDGELEVKTEIKVKKNSIIENLFKVTKSKQELLNISDTCALSTVFNINPITFLKIIEQYSSIKIKKEKIPIITAWNGKANISVKGSKLIENKFVSYEFDDDFNKVEIIKIVKDKIWDIQATLGVNKTAFDSIFIENKMYRSKKDTLLFKSSNFIIKNIGNGFLCYNKNINRPQLKNNSKTDNINIEINYKKIIPLIKEVGIINYDTTFFNNLNLKNLKIRVNKKEGVNIFSNFYFTDKNKNSFFSIIENFTSKNE